MCEASVNQKSTNIFGEKKKGSKLRKEQRNEVFCE